MKFKASVKVMRSYDHCHFEVVLGTDEPHDLDGVNEMRKRAALLADEAVRQYQVAKKKEASRSDKQWQVEQFLDSVKRIQEKPETELTPAEAAVMRSHADRSYLQGLEEDSYYYADERDHHFSMLHQFQKTRVGA